MRTRLEASIFFVTITLAPLAASAETELIQAAGNGPWITLAVIGMLRAMAGLADSSGSFGDDL